jgi:hypothetical protein
MTSENNPARPFAHSLWASFPSTMRDEAEARAAQTAEDVLSGIIEKQNTRGWILRSVDDADKALAEAEGNDISISSAEEMVRMSLALKEDILQFEGKNLDFSESELLTIEQGLHRLQDAAVLYTEKRAGLIHGAVQSILAGLNATGFDEGKVVLAEQLIEKLVENMPVEVDTETGTRSVVHDFSSILVKPDAATFVENVIGFIEQLRTMRRDEVARLRELGQKERAPVERQIVVSVTALEQVNEAAKLTIDASRQVTEVMRAAGLTKLPAQGKTADLRKSAVALMRDAHAVETGYDAMSTALAERIEGLQRTLDAMIAAREEVSGRIEDGYFNTSSTAIVLRSCLSEATRPVRAEAAPAEAIVAEPAPIKPYLVTRLARRVWNAFPSLRPGAA